MRKSFVALLLLAGAAASMTSLALATEDGQSQFGDLGNKLVNARTVKERLSRAARQGTASVSALGDTTWIGHAPTGPYQAGPFHVGAAQYPADYPIGTVSFNGIWDWDHFNNNGNNGFPVENDSLQGWWPIRRQYSINGGLVQPDTQRPWWALDYGNVGNYVLNSVQQARTTGVIGYWHVDRGNGTPGPLNLITWAPINGSGSAWCGLRAHGDLSHTDPITTNPFNQQIVDEWNENGAGSGTSKLFPGYLNQMDQILYRDVLLTNVNASLNLTFNYRTAMSTQANSTPGVQCGWFVFDPSTLGNVATAPNTNKPNYVSNSAGTDPADSFMVYLGVPVDVNNYFRADGQTRKVYDVYRRWLSEVVRLDKQLDEVVSVGGTTVGTQSKTVFIAAGGLANYYNATTDHYLRIVFRVKTNQSFSDGDGGVAGNYNSGHQGAVLLDDIAVSGSGLSGGILTTSTFEDKDGTSSINNTLATTAHPDGAWVSTGKPPGIYHHTHPLTGGNIGGGNVYSALVYNDICGIPAPGKQRFCNLGGVVMSSGTHPGEEAGGVSGVDMPGDIERMDGMISPTINLLSTGAGDFNDQGIDANIAAINDDIYVQYDLYAGVYNLNFTGNAWQFSFQSYPSRQLDPTTNTYTGAQSYKCWGELRGPGFQIFNPDVQCFTDVEAGFANGLIFTSNGTGIPDSVRVFLGKNQQCFRFGVPPSACSSTAGSYFDNVSFGINNGSGGGGLNASLDIWRWINDAFPINETLVPTGGNLDTCAAMIKTGINSAQGTGNVNRYDIPGDSTLIIVDNGAPERCDMVFRIKPGPGNFHTIGNIASGLRPVPTDAVNISASGDGDPAKPNYGPVGNFWGQYMAHPGDFATPGGHSSAGASTSFWDINVWNSARCDTATFHGWRNNTTRSFRDDVTFGNFPQFAAVYHETDPHFNILGISAPLCFQINKSLSANSSNLQCNGTLPASGWVTAGAGYDAAYYNPPNQTCNNCTREGTKIIPDGLLVPGASMQYFFRVSLQGNTNDFVLVPDTNVVWQVNAEGSTDGHRWQSFGILPDRWKASAFNSSPYSEGGADMACMLYVDLNDRRGNERVWVSVADSIGATAASRRGAHNGWKANGTDLYVDPNTGDPINITGTSMQVAANGGQPGTTWDMYGVKASESLTTSSGALGCRFAVQTQPTDFSYKKDAKMGPTQLMLENYKVLFILTGDLNSGVLGAFINRSQNDVRLLTNWLTGTTNRSMYVAGDGFAQSEYQSGIVFPEHAFLLNNLMGAAMRINAGIPAYSFQPFTNNFNQYIALNLNPAGPLGGTTNQYSVGNACLWGNDVLDLFGSGQKVAEYVSATGPGAPYISGIYNKPSGASNHYESWLDAWDVEHLFGQYGGSGGSYGRVAYYFNLFTKIQAQSGCTVQGTPIAFPSGVGPGNEALVDYMMVKNNVLRSGVAKVDFGLARADRVQIRIYDVAGRAVRTLANKYFTAGQYSLPWDGTDDSGVQLARGVYFAQVRYTASKFTDAKRLIVLK